MKTSQISIQLFSLSLLGLALLTACSAATTRRREATFPRVVVAPFAVVPQSLAGAPAQSAQDVFAQLLAEEATASAQRTVLQEGIGATVERVPSPAEAAGQVLVTGTVTLPTSLPPGLHGLRADSRQGRLAVVTLQLIGTDGRPLRIAEAEISWREGRWLTGSPRFRRSRPTPSVLRDAVRDLVEKGVRRLKG